MLTRGKQKAELRQVKYADCRGKELIPQTSACEIARTFPGCARQNSSKAPISLEINAFSISARYTLSGPVSDGAPWNAAHGFQTEGLRAPA